MEKLTETVVRNENTSLNSFMVATEALEKLSDIRDWLDHEPTTRLSIFKRPKENVLTAKFRTDLVGRTLGIAVEYNDAGGLEHFEISALRNPWDRLALKQKVHGYPEGFTVGQGLNYDEERLYRNIQSVIENQDDKENHEENQLLLHTFTLFSSAAHSWVLRNRNKTN